MIKIKRENTPTALKGSPKKGTHYNKKQVVQVLWNMQKEKCCYCEQKIPPEGHAKAVEHFHPKSIFRFLKNDWENLLLVCAQCNGIKSDKFPIELTKDKNNPKVIYLKKTTKNKSGKALLIDPSDSKIDPEDHITFIVDDRKIAEYGLPTERNKSKLGRMTIDIINLQGLFHTRKRRDFLHDKLLPGYSNLLKALDLGDSDKIDIEKKRFEMWMSSHNDYAAFARVFCRKRKMDKSPFNITITKGWN